MNHPLPLSQRQYGLTLIELMVALVIGMLVMLAATTGATYFESNRRNTMGNNGALENGIATGFNLQREIQGAGLWTVNAPCQKIYKYNYTTNAWEVSSDVSTASMLGAPVSITGAASATDSDSITVRGISRMMGAPVTLTNNASGADLPVSDTSSFNIGDSILLRPPTGSSTPAACYVAVVTQVQTSAMRIQTRPSDTGLSVNASPSTYNWPTNSQVFNLGQFRTATYQVTATSGSIEKFTFETVENGATTVLAENIVLLRAQYGVSANATNIGIDHWVNADSTDAMANRLRAVRIIVVARSQQPNLKDKDSSGSCITTTSSNSPSIGSIWNTSSNDDTPKALDLGISTNATRSCYQYRATTLTIPLKNYIFTGGGA